MGLVWPCVCRPRPSEQAAPGWCRDGAQRLCRLCEPSLDPAPWQSVDTLDLLTELTERCAQLLDIAAAGFLLADPFDQLRVVAATTEEAMPSTRSRGR